MASDQQRVLRPIGQHETMTNIFQETNQLSGFGTTVRGLAQNLKPVLFGKKLTVLSVSLLNGRFKALSILNGSVHLGWEYPGHIASREILRQALEESIHHTHFSGKHLTMLVEDPRFITQTLQVPHMPLADLLPILERKVQQLKTWEGPASWRYRHGLEVRQKMNIHLEIWPYHLIDDIVEVSQDLGLHLQQLSPISALTESQLSTLPSEPGHGTLLVSMMEGKIVFVAGREDGSPIWTRHLFPAQDWVPLGERVGTEINRTILFLSQQTNLSIPTVWFLGEEERLTVQEIQPYLSTPVVPCPIAPDWKYWLWVTATLPVKHPSNFTPVKVLQAPWRSLLRKSAVALVALLLIVSICTTATIQGYLTKHLATVQATTGLALALQQEHTRWNSQLVTLKRQRAWAHKILNPMAQALEGPFLSYLGQVVPSPIILHKASITRTDQGWSVELGGTTHANLVATLQLLDSLVNALEKSPYHVTFQPDWREALLTQMASMPKEGDATPGYRFLMKGGIG